MDNKGLIKYANYKPASFLTIEIVITDLLFYLSICNPCRYSFISLEFLFFIQENLFVSSEAG